jgi:hypothetical protein
MARLAERLRHAHELLTAATERTKAKTDLDQPTKLSGQAKRGSPAKHVRLPEPSGWAGNVGVSRLVAPKSQAGPLVSEGEVGSGTTELPEKAQPAG